METKQESSRRRSKEYYVRNKEKLKEYHRNNYHLNKDEILRKQRDRYELDKEKIAIRHKEYLQNNPQKAIEYRERNKDKIREYNKSWRLNKEYGLSHAEYLAMFEHQNNKCGICETVFYTNGGDYKPHVDHDHKTGKVRGLLCHYCNVALGHIDDNITTARRMLQYLNEHSVVDLNNTSKDGSATTDRETHSLG